MTAYEIVIAGLVSAYALVFLLRPSPALVRESRDLEREPVVETAKREDAASGKRAPSLFPEGGEEKPTPAEKPTPLEQHEKPPAAGEIPAKHVAPAEVVAPVTPEAVPVRSWFTRLKDGLAKTRNQMFSGLDSLFVSKETRVKREAAAEVLFEMLIRSDVGVKTTERLVEAVQGRLPHAELENAEELKLALREEIISLFSSVSSDRPSLSQTSQLRGHHVVMIVGVNGVGKTTTTGKLARLMRDSGAEVVVGAADTFRAAAVDQLRVWAHRAQAEFVTFKEGADPASVAFEAVKTASGKSSDQGAVICLVDTAGRLHNRKDLMDELSKVKRVMGKALAGAPHEVLLVVDATTGQNAIQQARTFMNVVDVDGLILTKLDGTAKGGVALAIAGDLKLPIRYLGVGESVEDLRPFDAASFVDALFS